MDLGNSIRILEHDPSQIFIEWFEHFHVNIGIVKIWESYSEEVLGVMIDRDFKSKEYIKTVLSKAGSKLTALVTLLL